MRDRFVLGWLLILRHRKVAPKAKVGKVPPVPSTIRLLGSEHQPFSSPGQGTQEAPEADSHSFPHLRVPVYHVRPGAPNGGPSVPGVGLIGLRASAQDPKDTRQLAPW